MLKLQARRHQSLTGSTTTDPFRIRCHPTDCNVQPSRVFAHHGALLNSAPICSTVMSRFVPRQGSEGHRSVRREPFEQGCAASSASTPGPVRQRVCPQGLRADQRLSEEGGVDLSFFDQESGERWVPFVIEPSAGLTRCVQAFLLDAYDEDEVLECQGRRRQAHGAAL
jgi:hypothetical protein